MQFQDTMKDESLAPALLPVLLHDLANVTHTLTCLKAVLDLDGGEQLFARSTADLARSGQVAQDLGWAMAVLGSATGSDLLLDRREVRGLGILIELVEKVCARMGHAPLRIPPTGDLQGLSPIPLMTSQVLQGWELPWALGETLFQGCKAVARSSGDTGLQLRWGISRLPNGWSWVLQVPVDCDGESVARGLSRAAVALPGVEFVASPDCAGERPTSETPDSQYRTPGSLLLPGDWLVSQID